VASIKRGDPNSRQVGIHTENSGRFTTTNTTLKILIGFAYGVNNNQIAGGPTWIDSDVFSIEARPESATAFQSDSERQRNVPAMLQTLLADRFKVVVHSEKREQPAYDLVIAKGGPKLRETDPSFTSQNLNGRSGNLVAEGLPMSAWAASLSRQLGRSVIDKTGLSGRYDFKLTYTPEAQECVFGRTVTPQELPPPDPNAVSIFTALQEQIGLKLEATKTVVDVLVIDHVEKPDAN
jgi:uncharacterized protein (TIGR03435 family)